MRRVWGVSALLAACTIAVYWRVGTFGFVSYDDPFFVTGNRHVLNGLTSANFAWAFRTLDGIWHPLVWLSHALDVQLYGTWAGGHHLTNLGWHVSTSVLLLWACFRLTGNLWPSALVAALFALHPLHAESVSWISDRKDMVASFFFIGALWAYAGYARRPGVVNYALVSLAMVLGLMAKPTLVTAPFVMLLLDYWPLGRFRWGPTEPGANWPPPCAARPWYWLVAEKLPWLLLVVVASVVTVRAENEIGALDWLPGLTWQSRLCNALIVCWLYVGKLVWPSGLMFFYPHPGNDVSRLAALAAAAAIVAVLALAVWQVRRRPYFLVGCLWYLGTLVPVIGLVQVGGHRMADRYTDIPAIGLYLLLAWALAELCRKAPDLVTSAAFAAIFALLLLGGLSWRQSATWRDSTALYRHALSVDPNNWVALNNMAQLLERQQQFAKSRELYQRAALANPDSRSSFNGLASALIRENRLPEAIEILEKLVARHPDYAAGLTNLGIAYSKVGRTADAEQQFNEALRFGGKDAAVHRSYGIFLAQQGKIDEAVEQFREAARLAVYSQDDYFNTALTLLNAQRHAQAYDAFTDVIQRWPQLADAYVGRAQAAAGLGRGSDAILDYRQALNLDPKSQPALLGQAWILATAPEAELRNGVTAVRLAEQACQATSYQSPRALDTLAAACAEAGRFQQVEELALRAQELARQMGDRQLAAAIEERLKVYRQKQPYREAAAAPR